MRLLVNRVVRDQGLVDKIRPICDAILLDKSLFNVNGYGRRFAGQLRVFDPFRDAVFSLFNLTETKPEPHFGNFIGNHYNDGASVHRHIDPCIPGHTHVRCNVMIKKPVSGGMPVLDGIETTVDQDDIWICIAGAEFHESTPAAGERVTVSIGAQVPTEHLNTILKDKLIGKE